MNTSQLIGLKVSLQKQYLHSLLTSVIDVNLKELDLEVNNIKVHLERNSPIAYQIGYESIIINCPLHIMLSRPSGLFSVEGEGKLEIQITTKINFAHNAIISHSELTDHEWIVKPELQLGSLNMPVKTLANLLINHSSAIITGKIDAAIKENVRPHDLIDTFFFDRIEEFNRLPHNPIVLLPEVDGIMIRPFNDEKENIVISAFVEGHLIASSGDPKITSRRYPDIQWLEQHIESHKLTQQLSMTFPQIRKLISSFLLSQDFGGSGIEIKNLDIQYDGDLYLEAEISKPVALIIKLSGKPVYHADEDMLVMKNMKLSTKPKSFLYQLVNPVMESVIKSKIKDAFPIAINQLLSDAIKNQIRDVNKRSKMITIELDEVDISKAFFDDNGLNISLILIEPSVNLFLSENSG